jgi:hypothetical protein
MTVDEIKANPELMTALLADSDITTKVRDGLKTSGLNILTEKELADKIGEVTRGNHEAFETTIKELTGVEKPSNTKSFEYAKLAFSKKVETLTNELEALKKQKPGNHVAEEIKNQQITELQEKLTKLEAERATEKKQAFESGISNEIGKIELEIPASFIEARFKAEHQYVEHEGKMVWKNIATGKFQVSTEKGGEPLSVAEIVKATYPEALKKTPEKKSGLGLKDEAKKDFTVDRQDYTYEEAEAKLNQLGITDQDLDADGSPKREKLLRQMTAKRYGKQ